MTDHLEFLRKERLLNLSDDDEIAFTLPVDGNAARYPFDSYLVIASIEQYAGYIARNGSTRPVAMPEMTNEVHFNVPGYVGTAIPATRLDAWITTSPLIEPVRWDSEHFGSEQSYWHQHVVYFEIHRPILLRAFTLIIAAIAVSSTIGIALTVDVAALLTAFSASILSLWALRAIITVAAPKMPTIIDYGVLALLVIQTAIIAGRVVGATLRAWVRGRSSEAAPGIDDDVQRLQSSG